VSKLVVKTIKIKFETKHANIEALAKEAKETMQLFDMFSSIIFSVINKT
jgi:hypothetical protein